MNIDKEKLIDELTVDEGARGDVYDDENDRRITAGAIVHGNPTTAIGHALNRTPWTTVQMRTICGWDIDAKIPDLYARFPWVAMLSEPRQRALANMAFNMGVDGLAKLQNFLLLLQRGNFDDAVTDLGGTLWAREVGPERTARISALIRQG
jgi:lysozyme